MNFGCCLHTPRLFDKEVIEPEQHPSETVGK